jgi:hypothetical protein
MIAVESLGACKPGEGPGHGGWGLMYVSCRYGVDVVDGRGDTPTARGEARRYASLGGRVRRSVPGSRVTVNPRAGRRSEQPKRAEGPMRPGAEGAPSWVRTPKAPRGVDRGC